MSALGTGSGGLSHMQAGNQRGLVRNQGMPEGFAVRALKMQHKWSALGMPGVTYNNCDNM